MPSSPKWRKGPSGKLGARSAQPIPPCLAQHPPPASTRLHVPALSAHTSPLSKCVYLLGAAPQTGTCIRLPAAGAQLSTAPPLSLPSTLGTCHASTSAALLWMPRAAAQALLWRHVHMSPSMPLPSPAPPDSQPQPAPTEIGPLLHKHSPAPMTMTPKALGTTCCTCTRLHGLRCRAPAVLSASAPWP